MSIKVHHLSVSVGGKTLLSDINLDCAPGEITAIIGENGAGKSTLLNCMAGSVKNYQGGIFIDDQPLHDYSVTDLARVRAVLPQASNLNFPLSVSEVVRLPMSLSAIPLIEQDNIIWDCLKMVNALAFAERNYLTLSGGEKQRVQLARVLAQVRSSWSNTTQSPRYILLDEPTSALDLNHQYETLHLLRRLLSQQIGVIIIVHDLNTASLYSDKIVILKGGKVVNTGTPCEVMQAEILNQAFGIDVTVGTHPDIDRPYLIPRLNA